jgi:endonuclease/exonuclease/phosphatase family metal-dependent hydrolase
MSNKTKQKFYISITIFILSFMMLISCSSVDYLNNINNSDVSFYEKRSEISIVTYNIKAIYDKQENEVDSLVEFIKNADFDFVVFQELFDESTRDEVVEKSKNHYQTIISRVDYNRSPEFLFQDAGLFLMSKYPRVDLSEIDFGKDINNSNGVIHKVLEKEWSKTNDFLANKSVLGTLFNINDSTQLFLFTTHVQAIGTREHKLFQLDQIYNFINTSVKIASGSGKITNSENLAVLLAGDFNSDAYNQERFNVFIKHLGSPRDLHKEFHGTNQEYTFAFRSRKASRRFDYFLAYDRLENLNLKKIKVKSIGVDNVKVDSISISDHFPLKATLLLN